MKKARIIVGANYGDEGKGTVTAYYTKHAEGSVLNILTNGGSQRGHSIVTEKGESITSQHFGSGTYYGADIFYSKYFILNPIQFVQEYKSLIVRPKHIWRSRWCRWTTPYDSMANLIEEQLKGRHASCGMGIWNTIKRSVEFFSPSFGEFVTGMNYLQKQTWLNQVKAYYEKKLTIPTSWKDIWNSVYLVEHFIKDCEFMFNRTVMRPLSSLGPVYDNFIFENGQGLLLNDTGKDSYDTTPSKTGIEYSLHLLEYLKGVDKDIDVTAHYVTRPYLTRHGDGFLTDENERGFISKEIEEDRTNHFNDCQGEFRYGTLEIDSLKKRVLEDAKDLKFEIELTHVDEMDRVADFKQHFSKVNIFDSATIK